MNIADYACVKWSDGSGYFVIRRRDGSVAGFVERDGNYGWTAQKWVGVGDYEDLAGVHRTRADAIQAIAQIDSSGARSEDHP